MEEAKLSLQRLRRLTENFTRQQRHCYTPVLTLHRSHPLQRLGATFGVNEKGNFVFVKEVQPLDRGGRPHLGQRVRFLVNDPSGASQYQAGDIAVIAVDPELPLISQDFFQFATTSETLLSEFQRLRIVDEAGQLVAGVTTAKMYETLNQANCRHLPRPSPFRIFLSYIPSSSQISPRRSKAERKDLTEFYHAHGGDVTHLLKYFILWDEPGELLAAIDKLIADETLPSEAKAKELLEKAASASERAEAESLVAAAQCYQKTKDKVEGPLALQRPTPQEWVSWTTQTNAPYPELPKAVVEWLGKQNKSVDEARAVQFIEDLALALKRRKDRTDLVDFFKVEVTGLGAVHQLTVGADLLEPLSVAGAAKLREGDVIFKLNGSHEDVTSRWAKAIRPFQTHPGAQGAADKPSIHVTVQRSNTVKMGAELQRKYVADQVRRLERDEEIAKLEVEWKAKLAAADKKAKADLKAKANYDLWQHQLRQLEVEVQRQEEESKKADLKKQKELEKQKAAAAPAAVPAVALVPPKATDSTIDNWCCIFGGGLLGLLLTPILIAILWDVFRRT